MNELSEGTSSNIQLEKMNYYKIHIRNVFVHPCVYSWDIMLKTKNAWFLKWFITNIAIKCFIFVNGSSKMNWVFNSFSQIHVSSWLCLFCFSFWFSFGYITLNMCFEVWNDSCCSTHRWTFFKAFTMWKASVFKNEKLML